jgi:hypothetical protein
MDRLSNLPYRRAVDPAVPGLNLTLRDYQCERSELWRRNVTLIQSRGSSCCSVAVLCQTFWSSQLACHCSHVLYCSVAFMIDREATADDTKLPDLFFPLKLVCTPLSFPVCGFLTSTLV